MKDISRRDFLKYLGIGTLGLIAKPKFSLAGKKDGFRASDVIQCFDENATSVGIVNESVVQIMMDESIKRLTNISNVGEAWKLVLPGITENSVISIKVNAAWYPIPTHPEFVNCLVNSLTQMDFGGSSFKKNNIIIWDRGDNELSWAGFSIYDGSDPDTVRCFGSSHSGVGYDYTCPLIVDYTSGTDTKYPSNIMSVLSDYVINVAVLKNHGTAQVTLCLKNHYGSIDQPLSNQIHYGWCSPSVPSLNQQIRDVITPNNIQKIFIVDALWGSLLTGPVGNPDWNPKKLIMSLDTVACDYQGWNLINEERVATGYSAIPWPIHHIDAATQPPYSLGTTDINLIEIDNPSYIEELKKHTHADGVLKVSPNPFRRQTSITFSLPQRSSVHLDLVNAAGRIVEKIYSGDLANGTHRIVFNVSKNVSSGTYFIRFYHPRNSRIKKVAILN